jgi:hypothetical protein
LKTIFKKSRLKFIKTWVFPHEVNDFLNEYLLPTFGVQEKQLCHVFCGDSRLGGLLIDIDPERKPDIVADCLKLPEVLGNDSQAHVIADPPWEISYPQRRGFTYALRDILKPNGYLFLNAPWNPWVEGLEDLECFPVAQTFNSYRDITLWWVFRKMTVEELEWKRTTPKPRGKPPIRTKP